MSPQNDGLGRWFPPLYPSNQSRRCLRIIKLHATLSRNTTPCLPASAVTCMLSSVLVNANDAAIISMALSSVSIGSGRLLVRAFAAVLQYP